MSCFSCMSPCPKDYDEDMVPRSNNSAGNGRKDNSSKGKRSGESNHKKNNVARSFAFKELAMATQNFKETNLIGEGGFGCVYKGRIDSGQIVAIKQLNLEGLQGNQEFVVEVLMLSLLHHKNLVNLIGYCTQGEQRLLVYEYMPLGGLENHLFGNSDSANYNCNISRNLLACILNFDICCLSFVSQVVVLPTEFAVRVCILNLSVPLISSGCILALL